LAFNKTGFLKFTLISLIFLGLVFVWLAFGEHGFIHLYRMEKERQTYLEKIRKLEKVNQELLEQINMLRNDKEYIESVVKRELGLIKENEIIYRFSNDQDDKTSTETMEKKPYDTSSP